MSVAFDCVRRSGLLGREILSQFDLEFNLHPRTLRLYARSAAGGRW